MATPGPCGKVQPQGFLTFYDPSEIISQIFFFFGCVNRTKYSGRLNSDLFVQTWESLALLLSFSNPTSHLPRDYLQVLILSLFLKSYTLTFIGHLKRQNWTFFFLFPFISFIGNCPPLNLFCPLLLYFILFHEWLLITS